MTSVRNTAKMAFPSCSSDSLTTRYVLGGRVWSSAVAAVLTLTHVAGSVCCRKGSNFKLP